MLDALVADLAEALTVADDPLARAVALIERRLEADRVSLVRFDGDGQSFEVMATAGAELCQVGTRLPISSSMHYCTNLDGQVFASRHLDQLAGFYRSSDQLILQRGFRSGCSFPLVRGRERIGALNLAAFHEGVDFETAAAALSSLGGMLTLALSSAEARTGQTVLICHDDPVVAHGIAKLCEAAGAARVAMAPSLDDAVELVELEPPDVVVSDNYLGGRRVDDVIVELRRAGAAAALLVIASHDTPENVEAAVGAGASAYLRRADAVGALAPALMAVRAGRSVLPPTAGEGARCEALTAREHEVLRCLEEGRRVKQVALDLGITEATAKNHVRNIFRKLHATSRTEALREARRQGILA